MNRRALVLVILTSLVAMSVKAQSPSKFFINGLGRTIVTNDQLTGPALENDKTTPNNGVGGYLLFDLGNNLIIANDFHVNAILRARAPYGAFWGVGTQLLIRQFQISGKIKKHIEFQLGDINVGGMTKYTVNNFGTEYNTFESDLFRIRRNILEYENFNFGNQWRLQGGQARASYKINSKIFQGLDAYAFGVRTNITNDVSTPDRILTGGRVNMIGNNSIEVGANYVGLLDVIQNNSIYNYKNNVLTGNTSIGILNNDNTSLKFIGEGGFSDYDYSKDSANTSVSFNDYLYDAGFKLHLKSSKLNISASYRDVGPNYTSPSAQTIRINITRTPSLFPVIFENTTLRNQTLYDRFTDETIYNRNISPLLQPYDVRYNNITPYAAATPNRRGFSAAIETDTSSKRIYAELQADLLSEIKGEGIVDKRNFLGLRGGATLNLKEMLNTERLFTISAGTRYEKTKRDGYLPVSLNSTLVDFGIAYEVFRKFDLLIGTKCIFAKGNEYINTRNEFNQIISINPIDVDLNEFIYSGGFRIRFRENSIFNVAYNHNRYRDNSGTNFRYNINQLFLNFTLKF